MKSKNLLLMEISVSDVISLISYTRENTENLSRRMQCKCSARNFCIGRAESRNRVSVLLSFHFRSCMSDRKSEAKSERAWNSSTAPVWHPRLHSNLKVRMEVTGNHVQMSRLVTCELTHHKRTEFISYSACF